MNKTIPDDGRVRTVAEGKHRLKALRFAKTIEGKRKAAEDASSKPKIILEKLRQITYGVGFNWEERFRNAPRYTDVTEQEGGLALSPVAATGATTDQAFVEILHECNALCVQQLPNADMLEINATEYESLLRKYKMVEGKKFVSLYSTSRKKEYAKNILANFLQENKLLQFDEKIRLAQNVTVKRPLITIISQRLKRLFNK